MVGAASDTGVWKSIPIFIPDGRNPGQKLRYQMAEIGT